MGVENAIPTTNLCSPFDDQIKKIHKEIYIYIYIYIFGAFLVRVTENGPATSYNKRASGARWKGRDRATVVVEVHGRHVDLGWAGTTKGSICDKLRT